MTEDADDDERVVDRYDDADDDPAFLDNEGGRIDQLTAAFAVAREQRVAELLADTEDFLGEWDALALRAWPDPEMAANRTHASDLPLEHHTEPADTQEETMSSLEDRLYGTASDQPAAESAPTAHPMEPLAAKLYAPVPEQKVLHPIDIAMRPAFVARDTELADVLGESTTQRTARAQAHLALVTDAGLDPYDLGAKLYHLAVDADVAAMRGDEDPIDDKQLLAWNVETRQRLKATYGQEDAEALLVRTDKFTRAHPKLHELLGMRGIGSRPDIVLAVVQHVRDTNFR